MFTHKLLNILIPPQCVNCGDSVDSDYALCAVCWKEITFITEPFCETCGQPLEYATSDKGNNTQCMVCQQYPPPYDRGRSLVIYNDAAKKLILRFKHGDATYLAPSFAAWMKTCENDFFREADYLIPVPLHWTRLLQRRYNQSALLAMAFLKVIENKPVYGPYLLRRKRRTVSQGHKTVQQRHENVSQAFIVPTRYQDRLKDKGVILIDDVMTTGATLQECARTLKQAGCKKVFILTVARALKGH